MVNFLQRFHSNSNYRANHLLPTGEITHSGSNLLVISDLHLGEDLSEFGSPELSNLVAGLNNALSAMLHYFTKNRWNDTPWELVLAGDTFDFLKDSLRHNAPKADPNWLDKNNDAARRLNNQETPAEVALKVNQIGGAHAPIMEALVDFLVAGNRLVLISGNHDLELFFLKVQDAFRDLLTNLWEKRRNLAALPPPTSTEVEIFRTQITFQSWFHAHPGLCHIEHGHLSDKWCSVNYPLLPLSRLEPPLAAIPFIQRAMPYVADLLPNFSSHGIENLSIPEVMATLTWKSKLGLARAMKAAVQDLTVQDPHEEVLLYQHAGLAKVDFSPRSPYSDDVLQLLEKNITPPMRLTLSRLLYEIANANRDTKYLRQYAGNLSQITGAKVVLLGHSHIPEQLILKNPKGEKFTYINSGSWVSREVKAGGEGQGQTFAIITPHSKKPAQLYQWLGENELWDGRPYRPYSPFINNDY